MYYPPVENSLMRQALSQLQRINSEKIVYALLFLLPIFAVNVRHWVSNIFGVLALLSLIVVFANRKQNINLGKEEKILLWGFAVYFGVFILTSVINGWGPLQTRYLGVEIRFLLFVPIYLLVRNMEGATKYLIMGAILGVVFSIYDCVEDVYINKADIYRGVYSQLFAGPIILILSFLFLTYFMDKKGKLWLKLFLLTVTIMGLLVVSKTGARNAYLAAIILFGLLVIHQFKGGKALLVMGGAVIFAFTVYVSVDTVNTRVNQAVAEYQEYFSYDDPASFKGRLGSVGTRLEMWRVTPLFIKDHPVFGVSRGSYPEAVKKYIAMGKAHPEIGRHAHPHNVYSEAVISKGIIGLASLLWITLYPLIILIQAYRANVRSAYMGIIFVVSYMVLSLTDASTLIKGNYSSIYIIFLAVLFSHFIQEKQTQQKATE